MKKNRTDRTEALPPHAQLIQMGTAYRVSQIVFVAAKLGLSDHLADQPKNADELAVLTSTHAPSLHRLMRTLASLGILSEDSDHHFSLTLLGKALQTGAAGLARDSILTFAGDCWWRSWGELLYCVKTGKTGVEKAFGMKMWDYLTQHPQKQSYFNEAMIGFHGGERQAVAAAYDFSGCQTIIDVGGGTGNLLSTILEHYLRPRGVLFDLPEVVREAPTLIEKHGLTDRITVKAGDFFERVPTSGDVYLLSHVIHDWNDEQCLAILGNCRTVMNPKDRLLIIEMVIEAGDAPHPGKLLDIEMLVIPGGWERTEQEYSALLEKTGFRLMRVVPTESAVSVVEAIPV